MRDSGVIDQNIDSVACFMDSREHLLDIGRISDIADQHIAAAAGSMQSINLTFYLFKRFDRVCAVDKYVEAFPGEFQRGCPSDSAGSSGYKNIFHHIFTS